MDFLKHYVIALATTSITIAILAVFVYLKGRRKTVYWTFALYSLSTALWSGCEAYSISTTNKDVALLWWRINHMGVIFIPVFFVHFVYSLLETNHKKRNVIKVIYLVALIFLALDSTGLLIKEVVPKFSFKYFINPGIIYPLFFFLWLALVVHGLIELFKAYFRSSGARRNQLRYLCWGTLVGYIGGAPNFLPTFNIQIPIIMPFGTYGIPIYILSATYAIVRYRLMDITIAVTRAGVFAIVYTIVLGIPLGLTGWGKHWLQGLFGSNWYWASIILAIILATLGPFIYIYIDRRAEERLLKEQRRYQNTLKQASVGMTRIRNLRRLLDLITHIVTKTVRISYAAIYLHNQKTDEYVLQVCRDKGRMPVPKLTPDNPLISWITVHRQPLVYEEVKRLSEDINNATYKHLEENMHLLTAIVIIPSFLEDRFLGFFVLGEKISGQIYTPEDLNVFQILASQAALAIENARFFEETRQMQEQIATAEKMATIGTMADGLSHQINNRFYALSLIAGDTIDTIKMIDTSKCSSDLKEAIEQINHAMERIQENVIQGGEVVKGLLKYTRKGEEGFEALNLDQILDGTLDMVRYKINLSELDILRNYPKDSPKIKGNAVQLQEVFFNFIDNAYDAITERKTLLKEEGFRGKISIFAQPKDDMLEIIIEDNGMGIKDENSKRVFTPFFTTKASSHKGTGLGLYVIDKIITDAHKGKLAFESMYGKGTRFLVELPIAKE